MASGDTKGGGEKLPFGKKKNADGGAEGVEAKQ